MKHQHLYKMFKNCCLEASMQHASYHLDLKADGLPKLQ